MKILIVEDEMIISEDVCMILEDHNYVVTDQVVDYDSAITSIKENTPDLILIDINIQGQKDGIHIAEWINNNRKIPFIYTSSLGDADTINRAKLTNPSAYIIKPFKEVQLLASIEVAITNFSNGNVESQPIETKLALINDSIFVKHNNRYVKVRLSDIVYIQKEDNYLLVHTNAEKYMIRSSITNFIDQLPHMKLTKTHKSYAVNFNFVTDIGVNFIKLGAVEVPLSKSYSEFIKSNLSLF